MAGHILGAEGVSMAPTSSTGNVEVGTPAGTDGRGNNVMIEPDMQTMEHGLTTTQESTDVDGVLYMRHGWILHWARP